LSQKVLPFSLLLKVKKEQKFIWGDEQQKAFDEIKRYMKEPPVLVPPQLNKPFKVYVVADTQTIGSALIQESEGKERRSCAYVFTTHVQSFSTTCLMPNALYIQSLM
jgi:hypothetical protein